MSRSFSLTKVLTAVVAICAGNLVHANVSCTQRTRRNARLLK